MKKLKMYVNLEDLNEEEKRTNKISYRRLINRISNTIYLFNKAPELSEYDFDFVIGTDYNEKTEEYEEIYQYYLIDLNRPEEELQKLENDLIIAWSDKLDNYILMVDHFGTSWDYVMTDIEPTNDFENADL